MTRLTLLLAVLFLSACGTYTTPQAIAAIDTPKPTKQATTTPVPSATIDYQTTAIIAQQTADEARRVNAVVTAQYEQRILEQLQMTAEHEERVQEVYSWTQQAAQTVIPLTATQQAIVNQRVPTEQAIIAAKMTATAEYPSLIIEAKDAENYTKYAGVKYPVQIFAFFATGVLLLVGAWWLVNDIIKHAQAAVIVEEKKPEKTFRINVYDDNGAHSEIHDIPGTPEEFTELAEAILNNTRYFQVNQWQRDGVKLKDGIRRFRVWALESKLAIEMPHSELAPTERLKAICREWIDKGTLPGDVEFTMSERVEQGSDPLDGLTLLTSPTEGVSP